MLILKSPNKAHRTLSRIRREGKVIGFVATMGALHDGHLWLIRRALKENDIVVVSIFVNPAQFGPKEDLKRYPRPIKKDLSLCRKAGVDFVFLPDLKDIYPGGFCTYINVQGLSQRLCGKARPGHFQGVATVVAKLFNIIQPDTAYFGQKDFQQGVIIRRMVKDLNIPVRIKVLPTARGKDGLALSSRNSYLSAAERQDALVLPAALVLAQSMFQSGIRDAAKIISAVRQLVRKAKSAEVDYAAIVDPKDLRPPKKIDGGCLLALAVRIGRARLIDNCQLGTGGYRLGEKRCPN